MASQKNNLEYIVSVKDQASSGFKTISRAITGLVTAWGASKFISSVFEASSALENLQRRASVVFEDSLPNLQRAIESVADATGRSESDLLGFAANMGELVSSSGIAGDELVKMSSKLAELSVDLASFGGIADDAAFDKLQQAMAGAGKGMKAFKIIMDDAAVDSYLLSKGIKDQTKNMNLAQLMVARYNFILEKTQKAQGDAAKTVNSYANQMKNLKGEWTDFLEALGQTGIMNVATGILKTLSGVIDKMSLGLGAVVFFLNKIHNTEWNKPLMGKDESIQSWMDEIKGAQDKSKADFNVPDKEQSLAEQLATAANSGLPAGGGGGGGGGTDDTISKINELKTKYGEMNTDVTISLIDLGTKHKETMDGLQRDLKDTQDSMKELQKEYEKSTLGIQSSMADLMIEQSQRVADLKKKAEGEIGGTELSDLLVEIKKAEDALKAMDLMFVGEGGTKEMLTEAERKAGMETAQRQMEELKARKEELDADFKDKMQKMKEEETAINNKTETERVAYESTRNELLLTQTKMQVFHDGYITNLTDMSTVTDTMITGMNEKLGSFQAIIDRINSAQTSISSLQSSATERGLLRIPTSAGGGMRGGLTMVGERGAELVNLPAGSHVTEAGATRRAGGGGGTMINVSAPIIGTVFVTNQADETRLAAKIEESFARLIQLQELRAA